jgi:hypothetical protein
MASKEKISLAIAGASVVFLFLFAWFVWPTKYRYFEMKAGNNITVTVRVNRLTGETCHLKALSTVWMKQVPETKKDPYAEFGGQAYKPDPTATQKAQDQYMEVPYDK